MNRSRTVAAAFLALALLAGPGLAARADCCPPPQATGPSVGPPCCCGHCPTTLLPTPEPASLTAMAATLAPAAAVGVAVFQPLLEASAPASPTFSAPSPPASSRPAPAPLRL